ncbi:DEAD/DEAH box helicase [Spiroplasma cantharicola]|uniref:Helicase n=1 Tax=Spiroplasma cantharicola TaxID=362837 RepID=A0A0M4JSZ1_9MOLU|nr:DEAD/DEAH box helicase [Spiroplasma cantharicola]ALD66583.1 helicase [Spiroplasma cantharicola]
MNNISLLKKILDLLKKIYLKVNYCKIKLKNDYINNFSGIINWLYWINESNIEIKNYLKDIYNILEGLTDINELRKFMFKYKLGYNDKKSLNEISDIDKLNITNYIDRIKNTVNITENSLFNEFQKKALKQMEDNNNLLISAPTSVGKSTLIRWYALNKFNNGQMIIFIVPTLSLVNEYFNNFNKMGISSNLSSIYKSNSINILTQERALNLISNNMSQINKNTVLLFDEFYTTMVNPYQERSNFNWNLLIIAKKQNIKSYFLLPYLKNSAQQIEDRISDFKVKEFNSDNSLSTQLIYFYDKNKNRMFFNKNEGINLEIKEDWWKKILAFKKQTIVYISNREIYSLDTTKIPIHDLNNNFKKNIISNYIKEFITEFEDYRIFDFMKRNCLIHNGNMEATLRRMIEKCFRESDFNYIFCSSTITYGVNLNCERLIILNSKTDGNKADYLNLANLVGRVGRLGSKIVGEVFTDIRKVFDTFLNFDPDSIFVDNIKKNEKELENIIEKLNLNKERNIEHWNQVVLNIKSKKNNVKFSNKLSVSLDNVEKKIIDPEGNIENNFKEYNLTDFVSPIIKVKEFKNLVLDNFEFYKTSLIKLKNSDISRNDIFSLFKKYYLIDNDNNNFLNKIRLVFDDFIFNKSIKNGYKNYLSLLSSSNKIIYISDKNKSIVTNKTSDSDEEFNSNNKVHMSKFIDFYIQNRNNILEKYIKPFFNNLISIIFSDTPNKMDEIIYNDELEDKTNNKTTKKEILLLLTSMDLNSNFISEILKNLDYEMINYDYSIKNIIDCLKNEKYKEYLKMII